MLELVPGFEDRHAGHQLLERARLPVPGNCLIYCVWLLCGIGHRLISLCPVWSDRPRLPIGSPNSALPWSATGTGRNSKAPCHPGFVAPRSPHITVQTLCKAVYTGSIPVVAFLWTPPSTSGRSHQVRGVEVGEVTGGGGGEPAGLEAAEAVAFHRSHQRADVGGGVG